MGKRSGDLEKITLVHTILKNLYEAPTRGNKGTGPKVLYSLSVKQLADSLTITTPTFYRFISNPSIQHILESYGIEKLDDPGIKETRYVFNPEICTVGDNVATLMRPPTKLHGQMLPPKEVIINEGRPELRPDEIKVLEIYNENFNPQPVERLEQVETIKFIRKEDSE